MEIIKLGRLKLSGTLNSPDVVENTFREISLKTGAKVSWEEGKSYPNKKDPCIRLCGTPEEIKNAKEMLLGRMETQSNRVVMKMDVTHLEHPSLIGKGGRLIKKVMEETNCHIHFPDANKNSNLEKSNQVSISGEPRNVERARIMIRALIPVQIFFDVTLTSYNLAVLNPISCDIHCIENLHGLYVYSIPKNDGVVTVVVRCSQGKFPERRQYIIRLMELLCGSNGSNLPPVQLLIDIMPNHQNFVKGERANNIHDITKRTGAKIVFPDFITPCEERSAVKITGTLDCVYMAWQEIMNLLPACVSFDVTEMRETQGDYMDFLIDCGITVSSRLKQKFHVKSVNVKGPEKFSKQMLQYRQHLLHLPSLNFTPFKEEIDLTMKFLSSLDIQPCAQKTISAFISPISPDERYFPTNGQMIKRVDVSQVSENYILLEQRILEDAALCPPPLNTSATKAFKSRIPELGNFQGQYLQMKPLSFECKTAARSNALVPYASVYCRQNLEKVSNDSAALNNSLQLKAWAHNLSGGSTNLKSVAFTHDDQVVQQPLFSSNETYSSIGCIARSDANSSHCTYEKNVDSIFSGTDYYGKKLMAAKAMKRPIESEQSTQVPSSLWAGYGFSQSMPASVIRDRTETLNHYLPPSLESSSSSSSDDANLWGNILFKDYIDGNIWSNKKSSHIFSHSNYFDSLRGMPSNNGYTTKEFLPELLSRHGLCKYINIFAKEEIDYQAFLLLNDDDLQKLGIRNPAKGIIISLIRELQDIELEKVKTFDATPGAGRKPESSY